MKIKIFSSTGMLQSDVTLEGGIILNHIVLHEHPQVYLQAATKGYVDSFPRAYSADLLYGLPIPKQQLFNTVSGDVVYTNTPDIQLAPSQIQPGIYTHVTVNYKGQITAGTNNKSKSTYTLYFRDLIDRPTSVKDYSTDPTEYVHIPNKDAIEIELTADLLTTNHPTEDLHVSTQGYLTAGVTHMRALIPVGQLKIAMPHRADSYWLRANGSVVNRQDYPELYSAIGQTYSGVSYAFYQIQGQPWVQQSTFNTAANTAASSWSVSTSPLPVPVSSTQPIITRHYLYLFGGVTATGASQSVLRSTLSETGAIVQWTNQTKLPYAIAHHQVLMTHSRVYLLGGVVNGYHSSAVFSAAIDADGVVGNWGFSNPLPETVTHAQLAVVNDRVYLIGGYDGATALSSVFSSQITPDGSISGWSIHTPLKWSVYGAQIAVTAAGLFLIGGYLNNKPSSTIYHTPVNPDGSLGEWVSVGSIPVAVVSGQIVVTKSAVYLLGGKTTSSGVLSKVYRASILEDGQIGTWVNLTTLSEGVESSCAVATSHHLYLLGGITADKTPTSKVQFMAFTGGTNDYLALHGQSEVVMPRTVGYSGQPWRQQFPFNSHTYTPTTQWSREGNLPARLYHTQVAVTNNKVYLFGGLSDGIGSKVVYSAAITSDGSVGGWSVLGTLPTELYGAQVIATQNHLYLIGGANSTAVYVCDLLTNSGLGPWRVHTNLPEPMAHSQAVVTIKRLYLLGKDNASVVYTAPIDAYGVLGEFTKGPSLPIGVYGAHAAVTDKYVYLVDGSLTAVCLRTL